MYGLYKQQRRRRPRKRHSTLRRTLKVITHHGIRGGGDGPPDFLIC